MFAETESTGIPGLDDVTGGLPRHALTMVLGAPGTGKTVLALQIASHAVRQGRDVIFLSVYSESHEKLIQHMRGFSFFDAGTVGDEIDLLSLKTVLRDGVEATLETVFRTARVKRAPLIILDGYQGLRNVIGETPSQELIASLSSQLPYYDASCIIASESDISDSRQYPELASADAALTLNNTQQSLRRFRSLEVIKMRGHSYLEGLHSIKITSDGIAVFPRLATSLPDWQPPTPTRRETFGLTEFDGMLGGGLPQFSITVIFGDPGTGKTTFGLHYLLAGARAGEQGMLVTPNESVPELLQKSANLGLDLAAETESGHIRILRVPPVEIDLDETAWEIRGTLEQRGPKRLVIDGLAELERAAGELSYEADFLASLAEFLKRSGTTSLMLQDSGVARHLTGLEAASALIAQNRIILRRVEYQANLYRICSIINMQGSDHDTSIREFRIGHGGITFLEPSESKPGILAGIARTRPMVES